MHSIPDNSLTRIGVFYDGNYFLHISNYYNYFHERKSRLSISGLHQFIRDFIAQQDGITDRLCPIVDAHYFRGRLSASEAANQGNTLYYDRVFDDILSSEGVTTHYLPVKTSTTGIRYEKGIDVWLALEAFELAFYKRFNVVVLIAADGDYVPLVRKLTTLGTRVMMLSWDFEYVNDFGKTVTTRTSQELLEEVTYPVPMHEIIDNRLRKNDGIINGLFVPKNPDKVFKKDWTNSDFTSKTKENPQNAFNPEDGVYKRSTIKSLKDGFGFIVGEERDVFFFHGNLTGYDFNDLEIGAEVEYYEQSLEDGRLIAHAVRLLE